MITRLLSQQSANVNWLELNKRERMHKRLLISLGRKDNLPMAFYDPKRQPTLLRCQSGGRRSSVSSSSHRGGGSAIKLRGSLESPMRAASTMMNFANASGRK